jgi:methionyl-tRNA formyltransferase
MKLPCYIFASSKSWHIKKNYYEFSQKVNTTWFWVSSPDQLNETLKVIKPSYIFFLHWNWFVPSNIYSNFECVCFHMTDVPYGRGGSPLQNLIIEGKKETQLTALRMVEEMDAGPIYTKKKLSLEGRAEEIYIRAGDTSVEIIDWIIVNKPKPIPQVGEVTIFKRRKPDQSLLPNLGSLESIYDHIRMLDAPSYPFAFIEYGEFRIELNDAKIEGDKINAHVTIRKHPKNTRSSE